MLTNFVHRPKCELCGLDEKTILFSKQFTDPTVWNFLSQYYNGRINKDNLRGDAYEIAKCLGCGFIWQTYVLNDKLMQELYNTWISPEDSLKKKQSAHISFFARYAREMEIIAFLLSKKPSEIEVLDFGMGWGHWCLMAKAFGYNISGFEVSSKRIEYARKNGIKVIGNFDELTTYQFDFINSEQVFEHILNPLETLRFLVSCLKRDGVIRIAVPNGKGIEQKLRKPDWKTTKDALHPLEHINCFTLQTLAKLGKSAGLELIRSPFLMSYRYNLKTFVKDTLKQYYRQYRSLTLFFKKCV